MVLLDHGTKKAEGPAQKMVDLYKKLLVGIDDTASNTDDQIQIFDTGEENTGRQTSSIESITAGPTEGTWKSRMEINPKIDEYGNGMANIIDFAVVDENGMVTNTLRKGSRFQIKSKVKFETEIRDPIFTYTFKTVKGMDITGTNTMFEGKTPGTVKKGDIWVATFTQEMNLQGGQYLLSISCTGYQGDNFTVYHRMYDVVNITVVSDKDTVGFYDMNSEAVIEKVEQ